MIEWIKISIIPTLPNAEFCTLLSCEEATKSCAPPFEIRGTWLADKLFYYVVASKFCRSAESVIGFSLCNALYECPDINFILSF